MSKIDGIKYPRKMKKWAFSFYTKGLKNEDKLAKRFSRFMRRFNNPFNKPWIHEALLSQEQHENLVELIKISYLHKSKFTYITNV